MVETERKTNIQHEVTKTLRKASPIVKIQVENRTDKINFFPKSIGFSLCLRVFVLDLGGGLT
jgi:hypothetical protein